jgi:hypothetical protein
MSDEPGDPVCWLAMLCPECGAVPGRLDAPACWRCGTARPDAPAPDGSPDEVVRD